MRKIFFEFITLAILFFGIYFIFSRFDWVTIFKIEKVTHSTEEKLGDLFWDIFSKTGTEIHSTNITNTLDTLVGKICEGNDFDRSVIKVHLLRKSDVNAFTLPNNHLVVFTGLIENCENPEELCGVLGHELAHMQKNHVMKKLIKEVGLGVLITMTSGKSNPQVIKEAAKLISSSAYDRNLEREADLASVDYLLKAQIDPAPFADFMYRLADEEKNIPNQVFWISTHPDSRERAENIIRYIKDKNVVKKDVIDEAQWENFQLKIKETE